MKPELKLYRPWELCGYSDVNYIGDNDNIKGVRGYIVLNYRVAIACHSQSQKTVTLSI